MAASMKVKKSLLKLRKVLKAEVKLCQKRKL